MGALNKWGSPNAIETEMRGVEVPKDKLKEKETADASTTLKWPINFEAEVITKEDVVVDATMEMDMIRPFSPTSRPGLCL